MDSLMSLLTFIGYAFCHQLQERSYLIGDLQMPLCARCIGIHVGFLLSSVIMWTGARRFASGMQNMKGIIALGAVILTGFALAIISYLGLGGNDNLSRTISGLLIGTPLPFLVVPVLNMVMFPGRNRRSFLDSPMDLIILVTTFALGAVLILLATSSIVLFYIASVLGILGMLVFTFTMVSILVAVLTDGKRMRIRNKFIVSATVSVALILLLAVIHSVILP
jgi:uncharacterized membrane protein